jgi:protein phosphatase PTC7
MTSSKLLLISVMVAAQSTWAFTLPSRARGAVGTSRLLATPEPLATEGDWTAYLDDSSTGLIYYFNGKSGESRWEPPTSTFPIVSLPEEMRRNAEGKRLDYIKAVQAQEQEAQLEKGIDVSKFKPDAQDADDILDSKPGEKWFDFLFDEKAEKAKIAAEEKAKEEAEEPNWFSSLFQSATNGVSEVSESVKEDVVAAVETTKKNAPAKVLEVPKKAQQIETLEPAVVPIKIDTATCVLPHPAKVFWGGEDAVFTSGRTFGVFDGVSGATKLDGVPLYSRTLAAEMKKRVAGNEGLNVQSLQKLLQESREVADSSSTGASTALVASITTDGFLRALNVGDSTCLVIRDDRVVSRTKEISHYFECPYQLSNDSPDKPRDGTKLNVELVRGDLVVMGSDGVFDNLSDQEIVEAVDGANNGKLGSVAKKIADRSRKVSMNKKAVTPYSKLARKNGDPDYSEGLGGKVDDISCVVVRYA